MVFQAMTYKYFFGSDKRSVPYLDFLSREINELVVITTKPKISGRGNKLRTNPVEDFCLKNDIIFKYFDESEKYSDMEYGICVSFGAIFKDNFINSNPPIFNIHLSRLPELRGPSPVETSILNGDTLFSYTMFKIVKEIDEGPILYQNDVEVLDNYSSNVYEALLEDFIRSFKSIDFKSPLQIQEGNASVTRKFIKTDYMISKEDTVNEAKNKIKAFDILGPAYIQYDSKIIKIHKYTEDNSDFKYELKDGNLYLDEITPEGKNKMTANDYIRGRQ